VGSTRAVNFETVGGTRAVNFETVGSIRAVNSEVLPLKYRLGDGQDLLVLVEFLRPSRKIPRLSFYRSADKSLARPGGKKTTGTEDFDVHISYS
jgi:hypothetical protein